MEALVSEMHKCKWISAMSRRRVTDDQPPVAVARKSNEVLETHGMENKSTNSRTAHSADAQRFGVDYSHYVLRAGNESGSAAFLGHHSCSRDLLYGDCRCQNVVAVPLNGGWSMA
jgi:hypothetical protein